MSIAANILLNSDRGVCIIIIIIITYYVYV